ncbi:MAG TPA: septum formation initiator family protein [Candidatus Pseudogracilibacillus intestinigallinarum]|uniref:Septum formation initiator family protein n=1 Tax=Candidatus Pseudogracilibacillus intestinigallinarum TaxID=2838742 RepID=A0A9D1PPS6_9BACI|nr:septum formation initiator family protein [Candidatus Pseudogracilibacillus intestinigallinarum]
MQRQGSSIAKIKSNYVEQYEKQIKREQRKKRRLMKRLVLSAIVMVVISGSLFWYHMTQRATYADKLNEHEQLMEEKEALLHEKEKLVEEVNLLKDDDYILEIARTNYFLSKEGELIFQLEDDDSLSY